MSQMCVRFWTPSLLHLPCTGIHSSFMWHCFDRVLSSVCLSLSSPGPLAGLQCMAIQHLTRPLDTKFVICTLTTRWQQRLTECLVQSLVFHPRAINFLRESVPFAPGKARLTQCVAMVFGGMAKDLELLWRPGAGMSSTLSLAVHCTWKIYVTTDSVPAMKLKYVCG